jgi:glycosyltransferase involved in cell wall biosynthesis
MNRQLDVGVYGARAIPSTYSGYETFLTTLLPNLAQRGHRVTMYCRRGEADDGVGEVDDFEGVRLVWLPALRGKQFSTLSHGLVAAVRARLARHDVVLVVNVANAPYCALARWTGQPVVLNTDGQEWLRGKWGRLARTWFHTSARISRISATSLVSDCAAMAHVYRDEFHAPSTVIPYCSPAIEPAADAALGEFGVEPGAYFVIAGRLNPENNIDALAREYAASALPLPFLVLGAANYDSPVAKELAALAARDGRIRPIGHVGGRATFLRLLAGAAAYVHGHSVGGMNPSLVEAMRAGSVVAALDTTFNRETLAGSGYLFPSGGLAHTLSEVLALDDVDVRAARTAARDTAEQRYAVDAVVDAYDELLRAAAARRFGRAAISTRWAA